MRATFNILKMFTRKNNSRKTGVKKRTNWFMVISIQRQLWYIAYKSSIMKNKAGTMMVLNCLTRNTFNN